MHFQPHREGMNRTNSSRPLSLAPEINQWWYRIPPDGYRTFFFWVRSVEGKGRIMGLWSGLWMIELSVWNGIHFYIRNDKGRLAHIYWPATQSIPEAINKKVGMEVTTTSTCWSTVYPSYSLFTTIPTHVLNLADIVIGAHSHYKHLRSV